MVTVPNRENYEIVSEFMENGNITRFLKARQNAGVDRLELVGVGSNSIDLAECPLGSYS